MILADIDTIPTIIQIPKQIQKQELLKLMPLEWLTNYEHSTKTLNQFKQQKPRLKDNKMVKPNYLFKHLTPSLFETLHSFPTLL